LISGVAPQAYLGNYKVFTTDSTYSEQIIAALEACVEDGMDVVNLSLGSEEFMDPLFDAESIAIRNAIASGVVVVAAAGNSGLTDTIGGPGQIAEVITVGSISNAHGGSNPDDSTETYMNVYVNGKVILSRINVMMGQSPLYYSYPPSGRFLLIDADHLDGGGYGGVQDGLVCESLPIDSVSGVWLLAQRGQCTFSSKIDRVQAAGGWGTLIYNSSNASEGVNSPVPNPLVEGTKIPSFFSSRTVGLLIKEHLNNRDTVEVEFYGVTPEVRKQEPLLMSSFSSLGPSLDYCIKPELVAVGKDSFAATQDNYPDAQRFLSDEENGFAVSGFNFGAGTSFSSPRVAGAAALVRQMHPSWTPEQVKSALVTVTDRPTSLSTISAMIRGGGHVNARRAMTIPIVALPSTLSWGRMLLVEKTTVEKRLTVENVSDAFQSIRLQIDSLSTLLESAVITPDALNLQVGERGEAAVILTLEPPSNAGNAVDLNADVVITTEESSEVLKIPVWARLKSVSSPGSSVLLVDDDPTGMYQSLYINALRTAGYAYTVWDKDEHGDYPTQQYMQHFRVVIWFMATNSLNSVSSDRYVAQYNSRVRFQAELTHYLAQGGNLLLSGQDWSDAHETTSFAAQVFHIYGFNRDPFISYDSFGRIRSQITQMSISSAANHPIGDGLGTLSLDFSTNFPNMADTLLAHRDGKATPLFSTDVRNGGTIGVATENTTYRAVFLAFPLERLSVRDMNTVMARVLPWLENAPLRTLSILSIDPPKQEDPSIPTEVRLSVAGLNFTVGNAVFLDEIPLDIASINAGETVHVLIPAGLVDGVYDVTVITADGRSARLENAFQVGDGGVDTAVKEWGIYLEM
jgi:hypothetical protein